ncbi:resistance to inhibitors of cholinesterase protein 3 isoform X2 [Atheta coriaria]|uniref:resistance to inhibitors of cholinesterase protein 3 isoform X2 n=1 Tax=Dalotia coriaria TaxID=877792 RepID=UPI0031F445F7
MNERMRPTGNGAPLATNNNKLLGPDIGPKKTMIVVVIVVGCFAVLWPKVFQPMMFGGNDDYIKPNAADRSNGCCDVLAERDINTIKMMSELCASIIDTKGANLRNHKAIVAKCREEVLQTCGIDIAAVLDEKIRLGIPVKRIINEVRSLNGSLCLKYNFGVAPWAISAPHQISTHYKPTIVRQERPPHLRPEMMHPAFRERGSNIPPGAHTPPVRAVPPRIVEGRPGPIPGMRPPMGGAGGVVPPSQKGSSMGIIMPIYTIGIVIFFTYTLMKLLFKKQSDNVTELYPPVDPDKAFRREVFESQQTLSSMSRNDANSKIGWKERDAIVNAMSALLDEVDEEIEARRKAAAQLAKKETIDEEATEEAVDDSAKVKVLGMETTASCEGGEKWTTQPSMRPSSPPLKLVEAPQEIYLEGALPANTKILVSDAKTETQTENIDNEDPAVVLAGKMTLSVIGVAEAFEAERAEEDSKYTTVSAITAAEKDSIEISDEEVEDDGNGTDDEEIEDLGDDERL